MWVPIQYLLQFLSIAIPYYDLLQFFLKDMTPFLLCFSFGVLNASSLYQGLDFFNPTPNNKPFSLSRENKVCYRERKKQYVGKTTVVNSR